MLIINNEQISKDMGFISYLPQAIRKYLYSVKTEQLEEVRLRLGLPVGLYFCDGVCFVNKKGQITKNVQDAVVATKNDIDEGVELITGSSVYAVENQIKQGFVTVLGGHRVGICGSCVINDGNISFIKNISGLNYRFAHEIVGVADKLMGYILYDGKVRNTLIIAPPACGKTTMIRDIIRLLSTQGKKVSVVDERNEIAGIVEGHISYDLGYGTDVLENSPKAEGMLMMLRSMSPDVIVTDEIGKSEDITAIEKSIHSGISIITTIHGNNRGEILARGDIKTELFNCFITLGKSDGIHKVEEVYRC